jgi:hypothetical protein
MGDRLGIPSVVSFLLPFIGGRGSSVSRILSANRGHKLKNCYYRTGNYSIEKVNSRYMFLLLDKCAEAKKGVTVESL